MHDLCMLIAFIAFIVNVNWWTDNQIPPHSSYNSGIGNIDNVGIDGVFLSVTSEFDFDDGSLQV